MAVFGRTRLANFIGLLLPFLCRLMGFKVVVTLHNIIERIDVEKTGFKNTFLNRLGVFIAYKFLTLSHVITLTMRSYVKLFKERYKCKRVVWIPHGTWKVDRVDPSKVSNSGIILYFGHSGPYKDLSLLLEAFKILKQRMKVKLIIAGESHPNYPGFLEKYKSITSDDVEFTGYVPEEKLPSLFGKATLVVLPYHTCTGTSGVAHLASSYGLPIVATDLPEFRELKEEGCGIILSRHDPETLAEKIELVLNNSELAYRLREKNLEFAKGRSWDKIAQLLLKVYIGAKF
jgi:glycosyltransferase involved in cell wall biosynthesis